MTVLQYKEFEEKCWRWKKEKKKIMEKIPCSTQNILRKRKCKQLNIIRWYADVVWCNYGMLWKIHGQNTRPCWNGKQSTVNKTTNSRISIPLKTHHHFKVAIRNHLCQLNGIRLKHKAQMVRYINSIIFCIEQLCVCVCCKIVPANWMCFAHVNCNCLKFDR